jgi:hypothetical protein
VAEAAREAEAALEHEGRHEGGRGEARVSEPFRERRHPAGEPERAVRAHAVLGRIERREERRMRGQRERGG